MYSITSKNGKSNDKIQYTSTTMVIKKPIKPIFLYDSGQSPDNINMPTMSPCKNIYEENNTSSFIPKSKTQKKKYQ